MSNTLTDILEKYKKVERGYLDDKAEGEQNFIDKHIDNVQVTDHPAITKEKGHPHNAGEKAKTAPRKKDNKGYEPGEDDKVYESVQEIDEELDNFLQLIEEAVDDFLANEASEEEANLIREMFDTDEGYSEFMQMMMEADDCCDDCGEKPCVCDEDETIEDQPKLKKEPKTSKADVTEETQRKADSKMIKVKTPEGKVIWRKQRGETEVSKHDNEDSE